MKKLSFLFCFISTTIFFNLEVQAQEAQSFGFKVGVAVGTLSHQPSLNPQPGLQVGAFAKLGGRDRPFFKGEALFTQKGSRTWGSDPTDNFRLYYFDLPLMLGTDLYKGVTVTAGIQPSLLLAGTHRSEENGNTNSRGIRSDLQKFDYSLLVGAEYFVRENMLVGLRYNHGFVPIQSLRGQFTINNQGRTLANHVVTAYLGFVLR
ncbi:PorT family protein [Pontibacter qinzhouensis]|uniref:PorT family protein n=1 Tax=Pontibacter qinzhouensis TaxID=2603253 RepID=A0A5C8KDZ7_9BACT|nr:porin family protein [Pontibacter qinzhouensis]TXK52612.1 PorT family protein [Pontibacter qinzhouensis]